METELCVGEGGMCMCEDVHVQESLFKENVYMYVCVYIYMYMYMCVRRQCVWVVKAVETI